jgi:anti-anti-sigma factor
MKFRESRHQHCHVFHLSGDIDMHRAPALRALFAVKVEQRCPALVLDFSAVDFVDSTGIAVLIEYLRDATAFGGLFCIGGAERFSPQHFPGRSA